MVAALAAVPGVPIRMEEMEPPYVPPLNKPIKKLIGANKAIAMVTLRPGIAPMTRPPPTPTNMASIGPKLITLEKAWPISASI